MLYAKTDGKPKTPCLRPHLKDGWRYKEYDFQTDKPETQRQDETDRMN